MTDEPEVVLSITETQPLYTFHFHYLGGQLNLFTNAKDIQEASDIMCTLLGRMIASVRLEHPRLEHSDLIPPAPLQKGIENDTQAIA